MSSSPGDRNSADAANFGEKLKFSQRSDGDSSKLRHHKPPVAAPKPKPRPRKPPEDEDSVLKSFDDMLDKEEGGATHVKEAGSDDHANIPPSVTDMEQDNRTAAAKMSEEHVASPPPDYNTTDEEELTSENVTSAEAIESPRRMDSETSDYRSDSRGSLDDDVIHTPASVADRNRASLKKTYVSSNCSRREV